MRDKKSIFETRDRSRNLEIDLIVVGLLRFLRLSSKKEKQSPRVIFRYVKQGQQGFSALPKLVYDVALINVTSSVHTYQGFTIDVNATVKDNGNATEDLVVIAYYDNNIIHTATITGLEPGQNVTVTIRWNTAEALIFAVDNWTGSSQQESV